MPWTMLLVPVWPSKEWLLIHQKLLLMTFWMLPLLDLILLPALGRREEERDKLKPQTSMYYRLNWDSLLWFAFSDPGLMCCGFHHQLVMKVTTLMLVVFIFRLGLIISEHCLSIFNFLINNFIVYKLYFSLKIIEIGEYKKQVSIVLSNELTCTCMYFEKNL